MPKNYNGTESDDYEATLYTDYDDAENDTADDFEERPSAPADFGEDDDEENDPK